METGTQFPWWLLGLMLGILFVCWLFENLENKPHKKLDYPKE